MIIPISRELLEDLREPTVEDWDETIADLLAKREVESNRWRKGWLTRRIKRARRGRDIAEAGGYEMYLINQLVRGLGEASQQPWPDRS